MKKLPMVELEAQINNNSKYNAIRAVTIKETRFGLPVTVIILFLETGIYLRSINAQGFPCCAENLDDTYNAIAEVLKPQWFAQDRRLFVKEINEIPVKPYLAKRGNELAILHLKYLRGADKYYTRYGEVLQQEGLHILAEIPKDKMKEAKLQLKCNRELNNLRKKGKK